MDGTTEAPAQSVRDDSVLHSCFENAYKQCSQDKKSKLHGQAFADAAVNFAKTTALFIPGWWGKLSCAGIFAADQASLSEPKALGVDLFLGAGKGLALKSVSEFGIGKNPAVQGALLGLCSRAADVGLTRATYENSKTHRFDLQYGIKNIGMELANGPVLFADAAAFAAAHAASRTVLPPYLRNSSPFSSTIAGATFGLMNGAVSEISEEQAKGTAPDCGKIIGFAGRDAGIDALAATIGSRLKRHVSLTEGRMPAESGNENESSKEHAPEDKEPFDRTPSISVTHSYSDEERALLTSFGRRVKPSDMKRLPEALDNISNRLFSGDLHLGDLSRIHDKINRLVQQSELLPQLRSDGPTIAKQLLIQVGDPRYVQQGDNPTCTVAALEHRMFARDPERAVDLVWQAATTATYVPAFPYRNRPIIVKLNPHTLMQEQPTDDPYDNRLKGAYRSHASQIFQYVIPNIHWQSPPQNSNYDRSEKVPHYFVMDYKTHPPTMHDFPCLSASETRDIYEAITGSARHFHFNGRQFKTLNEFRAFVQRSDRERLLPLLLTVDARCEPFAAAHQFLTGNAVHQEFTAHDICLARFDGKSDQATIHNPWSRQLHSGGVPLISLFNSLYRSR